MGLRRLIFDSFAGAAPSIRAGLLLCLAALAGGASGPAQAQGRLLTAEELDRVTAGEVSVDAFARALATGPAASTRATAEAITREQPVTSVSLRRLTPDLTIVAESESRDALVALARAEARAEGANPQATCRTNIGPPDAVLASVSGKLTLQQPGLAVCRCLQVGIISLGN